VSEITPITYFLLSFYSVKHVLPYATPSSGPTWNIPGVNFSVYSQGFSGVSIARKGYSMVSHEKVFHTILCHATGNTVTSTVNTKRNGKIEFNPIEYKTAFLFSANCLYFL